MQTVWHLCDHETQSRSLKVTWMGKVQGVLPSCKVCQLSYLQCARKSQCWRFCHIWTVRQLASLTLIDSLFFLCESKVRMLFFFFSLFYFGLLKLVWHSTSTWQPQTPPGMPHHTVPHQQQCPDSSLTFHVPRSKPIWTHFEQVGQTWFMQSEHPCKHVWAVQGTPAGVGGHSGACDSQPDPVHAEEIPGSYWFSRRTIPMLISMPFSCKILPNGTVFLDKELFDPYQLQNEISWTCCFLLLNFWTSVKLWNKSNMRFFIWIQ